MTMAKTFWLLVVMAPLAAGCTHAQAKTTPDMPALVMPAPPPRDVEPTEVEAPPPVSLATEPARNTPARPRPAATPRPEPPKAEPPKPEPPVVEPPKPPEDPPRPPTSPRKVRHAPPSTPPAAANPSTPATLKWSIRSAFSAM